MSVHAVSRSSVTTWSIAAKGRDLLLCHADQDDAHLVLEVLEFTPERSPPCMHRRRDVPAPAGGSHGGRMDERSGTVGRPLRGVDARLRQNGIPNGLCRFGAQSR